MVALRWPWRLGPRLGLRRRRRVAPGARGAACPRAAPTSSWASVRSRRTARCRATRCRRCWRWPVSRTRRGAAARSAGTAPAAPAARLRLHGVTAWARSKHVAGVHVVQPGRCCIFAESQVRACGLRVRVDGVGDGVLLRRPGPQAQRLKQVHLTAQLRRRAFALLHNRRNAHGGGGEGAAISCAAAQP